MATSDAPAGDDDRPEPFTEQEPFLGTDHKYYGYISGVGAGKTFAGIVRMALNVELWNRGAMHAIVAPTTTMIKDVIIPQMREAGLLDRWTYRSAHSDEPGLHAPNGARVLLLSADNSRTIERLAGLNLASWWLDEASRVADRALEILTQRLRVGQYRNGFVTTTPMGKDHIYDFFVGDHDGEWRTYGEAELFDAADRLAITEVPTWANPHTADDYKAQMEAKEGQTYEREILGQFVDYKGLIYPWFGDEQIVTADAVPDAVDETIYGLDFGGSVPTALVCCQRAGEEWYVVDEFYQPRVTDDTIAREVQRMYDEWGRGRVYCDHEPRTIEKLSREGVRAEEAEKAVQEGIRHIDGLRDRLSVVESCQSLIGEFNQYRYKDDSDDPLKERDHALDALRYALFTHDAGPSAGGVALEL